MLGEELLDKLHRVRVHGTVVGLLEHRHQGESILRKDTCFLGLECELACGLEVVLPILGAVLDRVGHGEVLVRLERVEQLLGLDRAVRVLVRLQPVEAEIIADADQVNDLAGSNFAELLHHGHTHAHRRRRVLDCDDGEFTVSDLTLVRSKLGLDLLHDHGVELSLGSGVDAVEALKVSVGLVAVHC